MPPKKKETLLTSNQAADTAKVSRTSLANWLKKEKDLAAAVTRKEGRVFFPPAAIKTLEKVRDRRYKAVNPALRKAWAARKLKGGVRKKVAAPPSPPGFMAAAGMSGAQAAKQLGVSKPRLYEILKRAGIRKPSVRNAFTPPIVKQLRDAMTKRPSRAAAPVSRRRTAPSEPPRRARPAPGASDSLSATVSRMVEDAVGSAREEARTVARRALEHARDVLDKALQLLR